MPQSDKHLPKFSGDEIGAIGTGPEVDGSVEGGEEGIIPGNLCGPE